MARRIPLPGQDLATLFPQLADEWDYERNGNLKPQQVAAQSNKKVWWKCKQCGMSWQASVASRIKGTGCPYDAGRYPIPGKTDLETVNPQLAEEWDYDLNGGLTPKQVTARSHKIVWWKCKTCGMSWLASVDKRSTGRLCPYDAERYPIPGKTDLATVSPRLAEEWDYERNGELTPEQVTASSAKKVWWKCKQCGMHWEATISNRMKGSGCPYDAGNLPTPGKTDLATVNPQLVEEWDYERNEGLTPSQVTAQSHKKVWWKCKDCGKHWEAIISNRMKGGGCLHNSRKHHALRIRI